MLTSRLMGVPSVLVALASLAPLALVHADIAKAPPHGTGSGVVVLPATTLGEMRGTLVDASGKPVYFLRAQLEAWAVLVPGYRLGPLDGRLYDADDERLVGTFHGMWDEEEGVGRFEAQVHPVGVPDPHHFLVGSLRGDFNLEGPGPIEREAVAQPEGPWVGPGVIPPVCDVGEAVSKIMALPDAIRQGLVGRRAVARPDGDVGLFDLDWRIDGLR